MQYIVIIIINLIIAGGFFILGLFWLSDIIKEKFYDCIAGPIVLMAGGAITLFILLIGCKAFQDYKMKLEDAYKKAENGYEVFVDGNKIDNINNIELDHYEFTIDDDNGKILIRSN